MNEHSQAKRRKLFKHFVLNFTTHFNCSLDRFAFASALLSKSFIPWHVLWFRALPSQCDCFCLLFWCSQTHSIISQEFAITGSWYLVLLAAKCFHRTNRCGRNILVLMLVTVWVVVKIDKSAIKFVCCTLVSFCLFFMTTTSCWIFFPLFCPMPLLLLLLSLPKHTAPYRNLFHFIVALLFTIGTRAHKWTFLSLEIFMCEHL